VRRLVLTLPLAALLLAPQPAAASLPKVLTQERPAFQVKPPVISYTGDGTGVVGGLDGRSPWRNPGHLHWKRYNHRRGVARGLVWLDDCRPNCADGTFHSTPVTVRVSKPRHGRFRRLTLSYRYHGRHYTDRRGIYHNRGGDGFPGYWDYYIIGHPPG
jgi:hypothetical protein